MDNFKAYIMQISPVTRYFLGITFLFSFCMTYAIIGPSSLFLIWQYVGQGKIWLVLTTFFYAGPFSMNFLFTMMMNYYTIKNVESYYSRREAEMATLFLFNALCSLALSTLADVYMVMQPQFVFSLMYVWCKKNPDGQVSIWGFPVKTGNLPYVMIAFHVLTGGSPIADLVGLATGMAYIYLKEVLPGTHGYNLVETPRFIERMVQKMIDWGNQGQRGFGNVAGLNGR